MSNMLLYFVHKGVKGFSIRSIRRFCSTHDIHRTARLDTEDLKEVECSVFLR